MFLVMVSVSISFTLGNRESKDNNRLLNFEICVFLSRQ